MKTLKLIQTHNQTRINPLGRKAIMVHHLTVINAKQTITIENLLILEENLGPGETQAAPEEDLDTEESKGMTEVDTKTTEEKQNTLI